MFGLEVGESGFYKLLSEQAQQYDYDKVNEAFGFQIGAEGRALLRALTWRQD